jgi:hypothetical protein
MEPVPHQEALSKIGRSIAKPKVPPAGLVPATEVRADAPDDLLAIVSLGACLAGSDVRRRGGAGDRAALPHPHRYNLRVLHPRRGIGPLVARYVTGEHCRRASRYVGGDGDV